MLGVVGETRIVMGCITQTEDGRYSIEDLSASLPLDLSSADVGHGFITGEPPLLMFFKLKLRLHHRPAVFA